MLVLRLFLGVRPRSHRLHRRHQVYLETYITHAVFSGGAIDRISNSELDEIVVTDTIPLHAKAQECSKIDQLSLANLLAESIRRVSNEESISAMFR